MNHSRRLVFGRYDYAAFCTFSAYASCSLVIPVVLVALAKDLKFPLDQGGMAAGGILHMGRSVAMCVTLALCGFAAARWGNRRMLGLSVALMAGGILLAAITPWYGLLLFALAIAGLGEGTIEGLGTPFVQILHQKEDSGRYVNFTHGFWSLGVFGSVLLAGWLLSIGVHWRWVVAATGLLAVPPALLLLLPERKKFYPERQETLNPRQVAGQALEICRTPQFWVYFGAMFLAGGGEFCLTFWCASFIQLNFAASALAGGIGTAAFAAGMFLGRTASGVLVTENRLRRLLLATGLGATLVSLTIPWLDPASPHALWVLYGLLFINGLGVAPFWPSIQSYAVNTLTRLDATMMFILLSCAGVPGCGFFTWLMGLVGDHAGLRASFLLVPGCFIVMTILIAIDRKFEKKS